MSCVAWRAIDRLHHARDALERVLDQPGRLPAAPREILESILDDVVVAGRLIRKITECRDE
jgi:hypothetical protein